MVQFLHLLMVVVLQGVHASPNFYRMELFGNQSLLYYYTQFYIGHPLQHQTILIDTGSFLSVIPCSHCIYCESERLASLYNLEQSRSGFELKCNSREAICQESRRCKGNNEYCEFYVNYLDGSNVIGRIVEDEISFENSGSDIFRANFGCINFEKDANLLQANGIMGLGPRPSQNLLYKWFESKNDRQYEFSVCLAMDGGFIEIGKFPESQKYDATVKYDPSSFFYSLMGITAIRYGRLDVLNKPVYRYSGFVLDTGATFSHFPKNELSMIINMIQRYCQKAKGCIMPQSWAAQGCFLYNFKSQIEEHQLAELDLIFPTMQVEFDGSTISWYPRHQFFIAEQSFYGYTVCTGIKLSANSEGNFYLMGDNFLRQKKIVFNLNSQTVSIIDNQTCKYKPYANNAASSDSFRQLIEAIEKLAEQYGIYIVAVCILVFLFLRKQISHAFMAIINKIVPQSSTSTLQEQSVVSTAPAKVDHQEIIQASAESSVNTDQANEEVAGEK